MGLFTKKNKAGDLKVIGTVNHLYLNNRWYPLYTHIDGLNKNEELTIIRDNFKRYIISEDTFAANNSVIAKLPKSSRFTHLLYLINYTQLGDIIVLDTHMNNLIDDTHSNSYTRFLETIITIEAECDKRFLNTLLIKYLNSMDSLRSNYKLVDWENALQVFPWLYLLPHYNKVYTELYIDISE